MIAQRKIRPCMVVPFVNVCAGSVAGHIPQIVRESSPEWGIRTTRSEQAGPVSGNGAPTLTHARVPRFLRGGSCVEKIPAAPGVSLLTKRGGRGPCMRSIPHRCARGEPPCPLPRCARASPGFSSREAEKKRGRAAPWRRRKSPDARGLLGERGTGARRSYTGKSSPFGGRQQPERRGPRHQVQRRPGHRLRSRRSMQGGS